MISLWMVIKTRKAGDLAYMPGAWVVIGLAAALPAAAGASILIVIWVVCHMHKGPKKKEKKKGGGMIALWPSLHDRFEGSFTKRIRASTQSALNPKDNSSTMQSSKSASAWRASFPIRDFLWDDHPSLVADAVEHGWSTFAFTFTFSAPLAAPLSGPIPPKLWEPRVRSSRLPADSSSPLSPPEIAWEVNGASSDYMQKIRLNPDLIIPSNRELVCNGLISTVQSLQTTLPLPGPPLGPLSFPQEGYYEMTVYGMDCDRDSFAELSHSSFNENEHMQLIDPRALAKRCGYVASDTPQATEVVHKRPSSFSISIGINDSKRGGAMENAAAPQVTGDAPLTEEDTDGPALQSAMIEQQICAIGLAAGSAPPFRLPGSDVASIGFFSNGRVFINGQEQKKPEGWRRRIWGPMTGLSAPVTVGCGFDPEARKLFFTLNGDLVEGIQLPPLNTNNAAHVNSVDGISMDKSMEFTAYPLFPTIGANYSVTVTVNFGQAAFAYAGANAQRVPNPCFRRPLMGMKAAAGEDSADLFSMGRINSQWLADLGEGMVGFGSPVCGNAPLVRSAVVATAAAASEPAISTSEVVDADLFEITLDSRAL